MMIVLTLSPLFETIVEHVEAYPDYDDEASYNLQVSALAYDDLCR